MLGGVKISSQASRLPIGCDLSLGSLQWACDVGKVQEYGRARILVVSPEDMHVARLLLGENFQPRMDDPEINVLMADNLRYKVDPFMSPFKWRVEFEKGSVESQGPS
jgi:hypothetical protein